MVHIPVVTRPGPSTQSHFYAGEFELPFDVDWGVVRLGAGRYTVKVICPDPPYSVIVTGRDFIVMIPASVGIPRAGRDGSQLTLEKIQAKHVVSSVELAQFGLTLLFPVSMDCKGESDNPHLGSP
ncbi:MAG: hypothetical protein LAO07_12100 [Acidobacteriia bacterium]|nr:hypothetical protein [Terriglobia bacterium]